MTTLLPKILSEVVHATGAEFSLRVFPELAHFAGHFPGTPILPGVVQIGWAIQLGERHFIWGGRFSALEQIKFQALILPDARLTLELTWHKEDHKLGFRYRAGDRQHSSGRIVFAGPL